jgi:hypothetical protein
MWKDSRAYNTYIYYSHLPEDPQPMKIIFKFDCKNYKKNCFNKNGLFSSRQDPIRQ